MAAEANDAWRILAVDDEPDVLDLYRRILRPSRAGEELEALEAELFGEERQERPRPTFDLVLCRQGDEAVRLVEAAVRENRPFSVVFLDVRMPPGPDGVWTARQMRALDPRLEIVIVTGYSDRGAREIAYQVPPADQLLYVKKPFHIEEIQNFAHALAAKWHAIRRLERFEELRAAQEELRRSQERYALAAAGANDGLWDWDMANGSVYLSPRWKAMLGWQPDELSDSLETLFQPIHPEDIQQFRVELNAHLEGLTEQFQHEYRALHRDGTIRWMLCRGLAVRDEHGRPIRMAGSLTDISERKRLEADLIRDAYNDSLTSLPNRALFLDRLRGAVERSRRHREAQYAVLFLDLDRFKDVNDSLGHSAGDALLRAVAERCLQCLRNTDTLARLGGDEFTVLLEEIQDVSDATRVADRIQAALSSPFSIEGREVYTSASIGIVLSATGYHAAEDVLRDADIAMYRAKALGKARCVIFDTGMHARIMARLELETDLRHAVARDQLRLDYQPIVSLLAGKLSGFEALVRWDHPQRGVIQPTEFIPVAEENGTIVLIEQWVLREACRQMRAWQEESTLASELTISVNISPRHFSDPDLCRHVRETLAETGLPPACLRLELTESTIMDCFDVALSTLSELRALGVKAQVDDFGTGYSSLTYLHQLPLDTLKVDRSFIGRMCTHKASHEIVQTVVVLAQALALDLVAEGVETVEQMAELRAMQCDYGQGFLFAQPLDAQAAGAFIGQTGAHKGEGS